MDTEHPRARNGDDRFLDQLLHPPQGTDRASGVDRPDPARVAGAPGLEEIKRLGAAHFAKFGSLADIDVLITDSGIDPEVLDEIRATGPEVVLT